VHAENLLVDNGCYWQAVEAVCKCLPQLNVVTAFAFVIEPVNPVNAGALMVSAQDEKVLGVLDLVGEQQADRLQRLLSSIDIVSQKQIIGLGWETTVLEEAEQVVVLSMDITADFDRCLQLQEDRLVDEDLTRSCAQKLDLIFCELNLLSWTRAADFEKSLDDGVDVDFAQFSHC